MSQAQLPGTDPVAGTYTCGHGRAHQIPADDVRLFRVGVGFMGYCDCGPGDLNAAEDGPHRLGNHAILVGGKNLSPSFWLVLDSLAEDGWETTDGTSFGNPSYDEKRADHRQKCQEEVNGN